jgi:MFS family permease
MILNSPSNTYYSKYGSSYFMTLDGFLSPSGKFYRYFPLKWSFLRAIFIAELGSLICAASQNSTTFVVGRIAFIVWEIYNGERSMLPPRLLTRRTIWQPSAFIFFFAASYFVLLYYLPIYFQSIDNRSAINSGVLNLLMVISLAVSSTISGIVVSKTGHAAPFMMFGTVVATIATGLMYTFDIGTGVGKWMEYQILYGLAVGLGFQTGINMAQANASMEDMSSVTAIIFCKADAVLSKTTC